jgi:hypothetical protein
MEGLWQADEKTGVEADGTLSVLGIYAPTRFHVPAEVAAGPEHEVEIEFGAQ